MTYKPVMEDNFFKSVSARELGENKSFYSEKTEKTVKLRPKTNR